MRFSLAVSLAFLLGCSPGATGTQSAPAEQAAEGTPPEAGSAAGAAGGVPQVVAPEQASGGAPPQAESVERAAGGTPQLPASATATITFPQPAAEPAASRFSDWVEFARI